MTFDACHITAQGIGRREIFRDDRDREHFMELLSEMSVHAVSKAVQRMSTRHPEDKNSAGASGRRCARFRRKDERGGKAEGRGQVREVGETARREWMRPSAI